MSWKAIAGSILFILILLAGSNFVNWKLTSKAYYKAGQNSVVQDSIITDIDTVKVPYPVPVYYEKKETKKAEIDSTEDAIIYTTSLDSTFVMGGDTVATLVQEIAFSEGMFDILSKIKIYPIESIIDSTTTVYQTVEVPVPADPPFYNTFWFASAFWGLVAAFIAVASIL